MNIRFASDLHLENYSGKESPRLSDIIPWRDSFDVLVLAGDISFQEEARKKAEEWFSETSIPVVMVHGNHEFYGGAIGVPLLSQKEGVHALENSSTVLSGVRFIGATLWTDFSLKNSPIDCMDACMYRVNDFSSICKADGELFSPNDAVELFNESAQFIEKEIKAAHALGEQSVVVTHFPPSKLCVHPLLSRSSPIDAFFRNNLDDMIKRVRPSMWIYGHNHWAADFMLGDTRLLSNPMGYAGEFTGGFDARKKVRLGM